MHIKSGNKVVMRDSTLLSYIVEQEILDEELHMEGRPQITPQQLKALDAGICYSCNDVVHELCYSCLHCKNCGHTRQCRGRMLRTYQS